MKTKNITIEIDSKEKLEIIDITDQVIALVKEGGIKNGLVNIQSQHTTATVFVQENEPLLLKDIKNLLNRVVPEDIEYNHDNFAIRTVNMCEGECQNGHSHCKSLFFPTSVTLNLIEDEIQFGQWQRVLFIELDRPRPRKIQIQILGE
ncbi:secondary thiamine-phosphate synthase enzyme YjbQ [Patescibacteria group bacterium]|nr:secondary thiamine-phosphate synthase enzyme YjbQ [Patescibacteria group bacterium]